MWSLSRIMLEELNCQPSMEKFAAVVQTCLINRNCWLVNSGRVGSVFELAFEPRIRRSVPLQAADYSEDFRFFEGESNLLVWCTWRLDGSQGPLTGSDNYEPALHLSRLINQYIYKIDIDPNSWDMNLFFTDSLILRIFCDHVPPDCSFNGNWDISIQHNILSGGPGNAYSAETRSI